MKKRVLSWLLPMLLLCLLPVAAWAADDVAEVTKDGITTAYADVDDAVAAWKDNGGTLKLLQDCKANNTAVVTATNAVLDLNGYKLEREEEFSNPSNPKANKFYQPIIQVNDNGKLTIKDSGDGGCIMNGQAGSFDGYKKLIMVKNLEASLTLADGTLDGGGQCTVDMSGSFEMIGGTIKNDNVGVSAINGAKSIEISDGTFSGTGDAVKVGGKTSNVSVNIIGGTFQSGGLKLTNQLIKLTLGTLNGNASDFELPVLGASSQPKELKLLSGTLGTTTGSNWTANQIAETVCFKDDSIKSHLPSGMKLVSNGSDGTYKVAPLNDTDPETGAYIVKADGSKVSYLSAIAAASGLQNGETLVLKKNATEDVMKITAVDVVIDLNGNKVIPPRDSSEGIQINAPQAGTVTIKNGDVARENGRYGVKVSNKGQGLVQVIIENVKFTLPNAANPIYMGENVYMINTPENVVLHGEGGFIFDGKLYTSLSTAQKLAQGQEIVLANNVKNGLGLASYVEGPSIINLNGHSYTYSKKDGAAIELTKENHSLIIKNGSINVTYQYDPNNKPSWGSNPNPYIASGALLLNNNQSLILDNVKLTTAGGYGISGNGTNENNTITLQNGTVVTTIADGFSGIYFPCSGTLTIDNSQVHGTANGVQMCAGNLVVRGDKTRITANGADTSASKTGDGPISDGAAISVVDREGYKGIGTIIIEDGQFESTQTEAVNAFTWDATDKKQEAWDNTNKVVQVKGGQFSSSVDNDLLADNLTVELKAPAKNPEAPFSYHPSQEDAYEAAKGDDTATIQPIKPAAETVTVNFNLNEGEGAPASVTVDKDGKLTLPTPTRYGYTFVGWKDANDSVHQAGEEVTVKDNVTFTAVWEANSTGGGTVVKRYDVTLADTDNGTITATHKRASKNSTVTITATPADGYVVDAVTVTEKDGDKVEVTKKDDNKYTFKMPASDVTVKATFKVAPTEPEQPSGLPFTDVAKDAWYFPAVEYVFNNGLMNGTTATTFAPNVNLNRAMMAAVLYNMEGGPACDKSGLFSDVADGKWYTDAVNWAASNNIVSGMPDGTYAPNQALTREQMASVLYRYAEYKGIDVSSRADLGKFTDGTTVSPWAQDVVQWAVAEKLINGVGTELQPKGTASRAQVATVLMNYCENVAK